MNPARAFARILLEVGSLVWRGRPAEVDAAWRRLYGADRGAPLATVQLYQGGRLVVVRGDVAEVRKLPGAAGVGPTLVELAAERGQAALADALGTILGGGRGGASE